MKTKEINQKCHKIKSFIGTYPCDAIPKIELYPSCLVMNTDRLGQKGEHWVACYINENGFGEYFDPYGLEPMLEEFVDFMDNNCPDGWTYNTNTIQYLTSIKCGKFCCVYLWLRHLGYCTYKIMRLFCGRDESINDDIIDEYFELF